jgi:hypothetical protein
LGAGVKVKKVLLAEPANVGWYGRLRVQVWGIKRKAKKEYKKKSQSPI